MRISNHLQEIPSLDEVQVPYRYAILAAPRTFTFEQGEIPKPGDGEIRLKLEGSGISAATIPVWRGSKQFEYPLTPGAPGREAWGIVDAVGEGVKGFSRGERVTGLIPHAYATYTIAKADHLVKLPDLLDDKPFPGESLGAAMNIFSRTEITSGQTVAIVGCGFIGLLLIQLANAAGAKVIAISKRDFSLIAAERAGANFMISMKEHAQVIAEVQKITQGKLCDRVVEVTGIEYPLNLSIEITGAGGRLIVAGFHQEGLRHMDIGKLQEKEIDMISAYPRDSWQCLVGMREAVLAIQQQRMDPFPFFSHLFKLNDLQKAYQFAIERPDCFVKALLMYT